jgi:hypothetical protein
LNFADWNILFQPVFSFFLKNLSTTQEQCSFSDELAFFLLFSIISRLMRSLPTLTFFQLMEFSHIINSTKKTKINNGFFWLFGTTREFSKLFQKMCPTEQDVTKTNDIYLIRLDEKPRMYAEDIFWRSFRM